jgi:pyruvate kinase
MHRNRHTKIVATLGPASSNFDMIQRLFERGVDIFRLNFSHGTHETHAQNITWIRQLEHSVNRPIGILADIQGPKLRVGNFEGDNVTITASQTFCFDLDEALGTHKRVLLPHPEIFQAAKKGDELLVDDGKLAFRIDDITDTAMKTTALLSGVVSNHKGVNLPSTHLPIDILTAKDKFDLDFALSKHVDFIGLSFVQSADDIINARSRISTSAKIIAKIEKPQAIQNLTEILHHADGVMIARGDLGVELPPEHVPPLQRRILREAQILHKPVIVATQMLESMIHSPSPTRAEVSDVATAVYLGTDAVMLSAESASGNYPKEAVEIMDRVIFNAEHDIKNTAPTFSQNSTSIANAAIQLAHQYNVKALAALANSFEAFASISCLKPGIIVLAVTSDKHLYRQLVLLSGVHAVLLNHLPDINNPAQLRSFVCQLATKEGVITRHDHTVVLLTGNALDAPSFSGITILN